MARIKKVSPSRIRKRFNQGSYSNHISRGKLTLQIVKSRHLNYPKPYQGPYCTRSEYVRYVDHSGQMVVEVHRYLRPDGALGASGKLDPKRIRVGKDLWAVKRFKK